MSVKSKNNILITTKSMNCKSYTIATSVVLGIFVIAKPSMGMWLTFLTSKLTFSDSYLSKMIVVLQYIDTPKPLWTSFCINFTVASSHSILDHLHLQVYPLFRLIVHYKPQSFNTINTQHHSFQHPFVPYQNNKELTQLHKKKRQRLS